MTWENWSQDTFAKAKTSNKLILLDVSAAWCHWCHVMEETTYKDPAIVSLIQQHFIPIKVDVDARPDIAARYGPIGWPATAFFTADAQPIREVGAYINPQDFLKLLREIMDISTNAGPVRVQPIPSSPAPKPAPEITIPTMNAWAEKELLRYYDPDLGGWGRRQKAPVADAVEHALWKAYATKDPLWAKRTYFSLLSQRAMLDPVWGGMYQYSVGGGWDKPHFEKIMTVQAGALANYAQAYQASGDRRFLSVTRMMLAYFNNFLSSPDGGFYTSQDADVGALHGNDYFCLSDGERKALGLPRVDQNVYARENGLAISAFCKAYAATQDLSFLQRALAAADRIFATHGSLAGGFFHAAKGEDKNQYLADNAAFGKALLDCYTATGKKSYLDRAIATGNFILKAFASSDDLGFYGQTEDTGAVGVFSQRQKPFEENVLSARFFLLLHGYTGDAKFKEAAKHALIYLSDETKLKDQGRFIGNYLLATEEFLHDPVHLLILGSKNDVRAKALHEAALKLYAPYKILDWQDTDENPDISKTYPAFDHPVLYICSTGRCSSPLSNPQELATVLENFLSK